MERDLAGMSAEEQRAAVMADAPELAGLLAELQGALAEVRGRVGPLLAEVRCQLFCLFLGFYPFQSFYPSIAIVRFVLLALYSLAVPNTASLSAYACLAGSLC